MPPSSPATSSPPIFIATRFLCRQRRDQSCSFPGTKFCSSTLVNADDRKGFERERFLPVASEDLSVFYFLHFSSLTVLPPPPHPFFNPFHVMFTTGASIRGGERDVCLIKFANENVFVSLPSCPACRCSIASSFRYCTNNSRL